MSAAIDLYSHLPLLTDIKWGPHPGYEYFNGGSPEIQKDFLTPFTGIVFSFVSSFYSVKEYCY